MILLAVGSFGALLFGAICAILAWRWWGGGRPGTS